MAITILSQPQAYMPVYNPHQWVSSSNQTGQPNFKYYITVTDLISSESLVYQFDADLSGLCKFNSATFAETFVTQINPDGLYGFQKNTGAIRKIRVNIGERYGTTPTTYPGSDVDYIVWNGIYDFLDFPAFQYFNNSPPGAAYYYPLTNGLNTSFTLGSTTDFMTYDEKTFEDKRSYLYFLNTPSSGNNLTTIMIKGYDANGNLLSNTEITNPYSDIGADYKNGLTFIDVGYKGLENMPAGQVTAGTYPIPVSTFAYYTITDTGSIFGNTLLRKYTIECEPMYDVITVHYLAKKGQFETINCSKLSERTASKTSVEFKQFPWYLNGSNKFVYDRGAQVEKTLNVEVQDSIKVNTDWLSEADMTRLKECFSSPLVYMDDGVGLVPVKVSDSAYTEKRKYNEKMLQVSFNLQYSHSNLRQRG